MPLSPKQSGSLPDKRATDRTVSFVIPVFNSADSLEDLVLRLSSVVKSIEASCELLLVNDGSRDASWASICDLARRVEWIRGINLRRNFGQHNALLCGIRQARGEIIVTMDDDLQHPPEEVPRLIEKLLEGYDVVYGTPAREQRGVLRRLASRFTKWVLQEVMGNPIARSVSAFRVFRADLKNAFGDYRSSFVSIDVLLSWATSNFAAVEVHHEARLKGKSNYNFRKLIVHGLNMLTGFSVIPLQVASLIGFVFMVFGIAILFFVLGRYFLHGTSVPGFPFLASIIALFSGAQLFALGVIGEYLARIHFRLMERPPYIVAAQAGDCGWQTHA